jgi:hypothetical protein
LSAIDPLASDEFPLSQGTDDGSKSARKQASVDGNQQLRKRRPGAGVLLSGSAPPAGECGGRPKYEEPVAK